MKEEFLNNLFQRDREQYERALRWSGLAVVMLLGFHLLTFSPFVDAERRLRAAEAEREMLGQRQSEVAARLGAIEGLKKEAVGRIGYFLEQMVGVLKADFRALSGQVMDLRLETLERDSGSLDYPVERPAGEMRYAEPLPYI